MVRGADMNRAASISSDLSREEGEANVDELSEWEDDELEGDDSDASESITVPKKREDDFEPICPYMKPDEYSQEKNIKDTVRWTHGQPPSWKPFHRVGGRVLLSPEGGQWLLPRIAAYAPYKDPGGVDKHKQKQKKRAKEDIEGWRVRLTRIYFSLWGKRFNWMRWTSNHKEQGRIAIFNKVYNWIGNHNLPLPGASKLKSDQDVIEIIFGASRTPKGQEVWKSNQDAAKYGDNENARMEQLYPGSLQLPPQEQLPKRMEARRSLFTDLSDAEQKRWRRKAAKDHYGTPLPKDETALGLPHFFGKVLDKMNNGLDWTTVILSAGPDGHGNTLFYMEESSARTRGEKRPITSDLRFTAGIEAFKEFAADIYNVSPQELHPLDPIPRGPSSAAVAVKQLSDVVDIEWDGDKVSAVTTERQALTSAVKQYLEDLYCLVPTPTHKIPWAYLTVAQPRERAQFFVEDERLPYALKPCGSATNLRVRLRTPHLMIGRDVRALALHIVRGEQGQLPPEQRFRWIGQKDISPNEASMNSGEEDGAISSALHVGTSVAPKLLDKTRKPRRIPRRKTAPRKRAAIKKSAGFYTEVICPGVSDVDLSPEVESDCEQSALSDLSSLLDLSPLSDLSSLADEDLHSLPDLDQANTKHHVFTSNPSTSVEKTSSMNRVVKSAKKEKAVVPSAVPREHTNPDFRGDAIEYRRGSVTISRGRAGAGRNQLVESDKSLELPASENARLPEVPEIRELTKAPNSHHFLVEKSHASGLSSTLVKTGISLGLDSRPTESFIRTSSKHPVAFDAITESMHLAKRPRQNEHTHSPSSHENHQDARNKTVSHCASNIFNVGSSAVPATTPQGLPRSNLSAPVSDSTSSSRRIPRHTEYDASTATASSYKRYRALQWAQASEFQTFM